MSCKQDIEGIAGRVGNGVGTQGRGLAGEIKTNVSSTTTGVTERRTGDTAREKNRRRTREL